MGAGRVAVKGGSSQQTRLHGRAETRDRLLEAAAELIARHGYEAASLADISRRAGLTTGSVYSTFGSKWELLRAVVRQQARSLSLSGDRGPQDVAEELHAAAASVQGRELAVLQLEISLLALRNPELLQDVVGEDGRERLRLAGELSASTHDDDLERATLLTALVQGLQLLQLTDPAAVSVETYRAGLRALLG